MAVINLRNVVALGVLEDGVYPSVYNGQTGEYIGTVDGEGAGVKTVPTLYMYYRKNGHLYLYRTKEKIEIDLTNVTAYDNSALFKLTEKSDISNAKITEFDSRNIDVGHYEYKVPWVKSTQQYLYILVPIVRSIHTITVQGIISNQLFTLVGIYVHEGKSWWIYRTNVKTNFDFNDSVNEVLDVQVYVRELTAEDLNPVEQLTKLLFEHINNKFNPHEVNKEQVGLGNVDNTADIDKPVSKPQKEYIDALETRVKGWFKQLNVWINNHVTEVNRKFQDVWNAINNKLDKEDYENDKDNFNSHIRNYDNPHRVTASQVGLPNAASDIETLKIKAQELQGLLINKQDKTSEELVTENKRIVDAINEIFGIVVEHNNHVRSNSIHQIEVTSEIPTTFEDGVLWIRIPRNEEDYITIKIEAVPSDSIIRMINSENKEIEGIGTASLECLIQSRLHYIVEKENYITKDVYVDVGVEDTTIQVVLTPKTKKTLIVNSNPNDAHIIISDKQTHVVLVQGSGTVTYETYDPREVTIQVGKSGYITYEENIVLDENITRDITLSPIPAEQGYVSITVVDSESKAKIAAYVYDKDTGGILGQVTKDTPLELTADANTSQILRFVASGYNELEQLVTYTKPVNNITIELTKTVVPDGSLYAKALKINGELISDATFRYHTGDNNWLPLTNTGNGTSNPVLASAGTHVYFEVSANGYITNTGSGIIVSGQSNSVDVILEVVPPEPSYDWFIFAVNADGGTQIETLTKAELFVGDVWVEQEIRTVIASKGFDVNGKKGDVVKVRFTATGYVTTTQNVILTSESEESRIIPVGMELLPPEPEDVSVTIRVKDDSGNYLTATIKEISVTGDTVGTTTPEEPLVITKPQGNVITYYALPAISQRYNIANQEVVFDSNKTVEIVCNYIPFENDGIDYMQIEGNGVEHPIFRVADTN